MSVSVIVSLNNGVVRAFSIKMRYRLSKSTPYTLIVMSWFNVY